MDDGLERGVCELAGVGRGCGGGAGGVWRCGRGGGLGGAARGAGRAGPSPVARDAPGALAVANPTSTGLDWGLYKFAIPVGNGSVWDLFQLVNATLGPVEVSDLGCGGVRGPWGEGAGAAGVAGGRAKDVGGRRLRMSAQRGTTPCVGQG